MRRRPIRRLSTLVLALLWLWTPIVGTVHGLRTAHHYCGEHGAFEEHGAAATGREAPARLLPRAPAAAFGHEECAFAPAAAGCGVPVAAAATVAPAPAPPAAAILDPAPPAPQLAVLSVAPKSSPPSA